MKLERFQRIPWLLSLIAMLVGMSVPFAQQAHAQSQSPVYLPIIQQAVVTQSTQTHRLEVYFSVNSGGLNHLPNYIEVVFADGSEDRLPVVKTNELIQGASIHLVVEATGPAGVQVESLFASKISRWCVATFLDGGTTAYTVECGNEAG